MKRMATLLVALTILIFSMLQLEVATAAGNVPAMMANAAVINRTEAIDATLTAEYFNSPGSIQSALGNGSYSPYAPQALKSVSFADEAALAQAVSSGTLPPGTGAVIYDDEHWNMTPTVQQQNPATYYQRAASAAHAHGLRLIATPAVDLVSVLAPGTPSSQRYNKFIALGIPAAAARYADVYESQGQGLEANTSAYASFTQRAAQQASGANPTVENLGGLSTNPNGVVESAPVLDNAAHASAGSVAGWLIQDPAGSVQCPNCNGPYPQTVVGFLSGL